LFLKEENKQSNATELAIIKHEQFPRTNNNRLVFVHDLDNPQQQLICLLDGMLSFPPPLTNDKSMNHSTYSD